MSQNPEIIESVMTSNYLLGIDLGGTKVSAAAFDMEGKRLGKIASLPTMANRKPAITLMNLKRVSKQAAVEACVEGQPVAVGLASTGPLDLAEQRILDEDSLPGLMGFRIGAFIQDELKAPLFLENDAACFALGEALQGAGLSSPVVVGVTLGTGFGCGIVIGERIYSGSTNNAGEVAYCQVDGGNFDTACSGIGVVRKYGEQEGIPADHNLDSRKIGDLAEKGDATALQAWNEYGNCVGTAIATICCVLDPSVVVMGGSISKRLKLFHASLLEATKKILPPPVFEALRIESSILGDAAGITGAVELARQGLQSGYTA